MKKDYHFIATHQDIEGNILRMGRWVLELVVGNVTQVNTRLYFQQKKIQSLDYIAKGSFFSSVILVDK